MEKYNSAIQSYYWVKENIKLDTPLHWGDVTETLLRMKGHCAMKSEVLVFQLRNKGINARLVEGHTVRIKNTFAQRLVLWLGLVPYDVHVWVEALINSEWITLDPTPDSGIAYLIGDTKLGTHLGSPEQIYYWDEIPKWFKDTYNMPLSFPLRLFSRIELKFRRYIKK